MPRPLFRCTDRGPGQPEGIRFCQETGIMPVPALRHPPDSKGPSAPFCRPRARGAARGAGLRAWGWRWRRPRRPVRPSLLAWALLPALANYVRARRARGPQAIRCTDGAMLGFWAPLPHGTSAARRWAGLARWPVHFESARPKSPGRIRRLHVPPHHGNRQRGHNEHAVDQRHAGGPATPCPQQTGRD